MIGVHVTVPVSCFRKGYAREYLETHQIPPPATCYGFLLSLAGERDRRRHIGCRVTAVILNDPAKSVVLRNVWRVKNPRPEAPENMRPDFQELLSNLELILWVDSTEEWNSCGETLEQRVRSTLAQPELVNRSGGLSLGESTHLVNDVGTIDNGSKWSESFKGSAFLLDPRGELTLPVWVDHVHSVETRYVTGTLQATSLKKPPREKVPLISPH
ncbi:CRISPR-associated protein Cas5 [Gimesia panareensis]|uniref:CRISPR-associated protein Cas5 n=1 Tax=Gimesia panareensis TaxID=2527978 RepID=A0A518FLL5_9PLAN|nr:type I-MYXAN CRISPR-associated protein Cas5/Cmx5/DevS [Gimesia panareensis]QDV17248.1 CRISPR-associated protein Cas5 [Gimesia panareensis]